ncbi:MAG: acetolactate synthase small subunit [Anaerolineae bacterium]|nr:acetolactate synthase small subunit [Anaerolineae bacterium]
MRHTIVALMEDKPGVLNRVANLFRRRGFNIDSLAVGHSETPGISRMTVVVTGDDRTLEQVAKQLHKLVNVTKVFDLDGANVSRELALVKVHATPANRSEVIGLANIFRSNIVDVSPESLIIEITGTEDKVDSLLELLRPYGVQELTRTGILALARG